MEGRRDGGAVEPGDTRNGRGSAAVYAGDPRTGAERILGPGSGTRVHAVEYGWLDRIRTARVFAYRLPSATPRADR